MDTLPIRVLVVDDSAYLRKVVTEILGRNPSIEVVGAARNGLDALEKVRELNPDVVTLDLYMPEMDGIGFLKEQMARRKLPVIICSVASEGEDLSTAAMEAGAIEFVQKPTALANEALYKIADDLIQKVLMAARIPAERLPGPLIEDYEAPAVFNHERKTDAIQAVMIGTSTGGPQALRYLLPQFPGNFPVPLAIVLHMPEGYTGPFARRLNEISALEVLEAEEGMEMEAGRAILAKAGYHLSFRCKEKKVVAHLDLSPEGYPHRPSVDILFQSAVEAYGQHMLGVVMTGMGSDGTAGAAWIKSEGGMVFTEAESSCVVWGMPRSVVEAGLSDKISPLKDLPRLIMEAV